MGGKGHGHDPTEKVSCAHKYRKGCDVDGRKMQPWMMIAIVGVLLALGCLGPPLYKLLCCKNRAAVDPETKKEEKKKEEKDDV